MGKIKTHVLSLLFFVFFLIIGLRIYHDYGIYTDEESQMLIGKVNYQYIAKGDQTLLSYPNRVYGPVLETILWRLTILMHNSEMVYYRHLVVFLIFFTALILFYLLACRLFRKWNWAMLALLLLASSPRIFADAFYNSKDIPFMVAFIAAIGSLVLVIDALNGNQKWWLKIGTAVLHALTCALAVALRIPGAILIPISIGILLVLALRHLDRWKQIGALICVYVVLTVALVILFWPTLWHDPVSEFINAFTVMSQFPWKGIMLYQGEYISSDNLPWHYLPVWIGITTPLFQVISFMVGTISLAIISIREVRTRITKPISSWLELITPDLLIWVAVVAWLILPVSAVYLFKSVLYDAWRQMFFVYPAVILIAVLGLKTLYTWATRKLNKPVWLKIVVGMLIATGIIEPLAFMVQYHPYENVYFNLLAGDPATLRQKYELDYWGLSYKQGVDYILEHDPAQKMMVNLVHTPGMLYHRYMLSKKQSVRIDLVQPENADYVISTFRFHPEDYPYPNKFYSINVRGTEILAIYRLKK